MNTAIIALGSNINPDQNIQKASQALAKQFKTISESEFIVTKPVGFAEQPDFLNGCVLIETSLNYVELCERLKKMETELGRTPSPFKFGPRSIDLDVVIFNDEVVDQDFYHRDFLKNAVLQLMPELKY